MPTKCSCDGVSESHSRHIEEGENFLNHVATHPDATPTYRKIDMVLVVYPLGAAFVKVVPKVVILTLTAYNSATFWS